jgi:hypothetical protein
MRVLVDTDIFCKLGVCSLLDDALRLLDARAEDCGRLPALPHMLRRGSLPRRYGEAACEGLLRLAESFPVAPTPSSSLLDLMTALPEIDAGEAQLIAAAAEHDLMLMTGDNRGLRAVRTIGHLVERLEGRVVTMEAVVLALVDAVGVETVRERVQPLRPIDKSIGVWFSENNDDPVEALVSYNRSLRAGLAPLVLWRPQGRGER